MPAAYISDTNFKFFKIIEGKEHIENLISQTTKQH